MRAVSRSCLIVAALCLSGLVAGCATAPPAGDAEALADFRETDDPLEPTNRVFYKVNDALDTALLRPAAKAYRYVLPQAVRNGVHNVLGNLGTPVNFSNDVLQGKPKRAGDTFMRALINSTVGVAGVFDVATGWGYPAHDTDFGLTLAHWGVPNGPFLFLPFLGPTNPRDATGFGVDIVQDPFTWVGTGVIVSGLNWGRFGVNVLDSRERVLDPLEQIKKTALDPYATFRSLYRQRRASQIETLRSPEKGTVPVWFRQSAAR